METTFSKQFPTINVGGCDYKAIGLDILMSCSYIWMSHELMYMSQLMYAYVAYVSGYNERVPWIFRYGFKKSLIFARLIHKNDSIFELDILHKWIDIFYKSVLIFVVTVLVYRIELILREQMDPSDPICTQATSSIHHTYMRTYTHL